jgi:hypothetical protein
VKLLLKQKPHPFLLFWRIVSPYWFFFSYHLPPNPFISSLWTQTLLSEKLDFIFSLNPQLLLSEKTLPQFFFEKTQPESVTSPPRAVTQGNQVIVMNRRKTGSDLYLLILLLKLYCSSDLLLVSFIVVLDHAFLIALNWDLNKLLLLTTEF